MFTPASQFWFYATHNQATVMLVVLRQDLKERHELVASQIVELTLASANCRQVSRPRLGFPRGLYASGGSLRSY